MIFFCLSKLECVCYQSSLFNITCVHVCTKLCTRLCRCYSKCVKLHTHTHLLYVRVCERVHVVSLWKTQCYHGNTRQSILGRRDLGEKSEGALSLRHLGILTLWLRFSDRIFTHLTSQCPQVFLCLPFSSIPSPYLSAFPRASLHLLPQLSNRTVIQAIKHIVWLFIFMWKKHCFLFTHTHRSS